MYFKRYSRLKAHPGIDTAPMADVVFQLLIFFMIASSFVMEPGIKVNLPAALTAEAQVEQKIVVTVTAQEAIFINEEPVNLQILEEYLKAALSKNEDQIIIVKADRVVRHGLVVEILDIARSVGAKRLAIATLPLPQER